MSSFLVNIFCTYCSNVERNPSYMPSDSIAIQKDVTSGEKYSEKSINWLDWLSKKDGIKTQHALTGGEHKIKGVGKVDGFCRESNTVYEFQGCFWHGCKKCFNRDTINSKNHIDMETLRKRRNEKNEKIFDAGFYLVETWEYEIEKEEEFYGRKQKRNCWPS